MGSKIDSNVPAAKRAVSVKPIAPVAQPAAKAAAPTAPAPVATKTAPAPVKAAPATVKTVAAVAAPKPAIAAPAVPAPVAQAAEIIEAVPSPAIQSDLIPAAATIAPAAQEEMMATVNMAAGQANATFGEMGDRFKTAFEKSSKMGEDLVDFAKGNVEAVVASARVAAKGGESLGQDAADYGKKSFESTMALFRSLAAVKSPTELFQLQSDYAKAAFDAAVAEASKTSEKVLKLAGDVAQPLSTRYAVAAEKIKASAL